MPFRSDRDGTSVLVPATLVLDVLDVLDVLAVLAVLRVAPAKRLFGLRGGRRGFGAERRSASLPEVEESARMAAHGRSLP